MRGRPPNGRKIGGSGLLRVVDAVTGLDIDCGVRFAGSCVLSIIDQNAFNSATSSQTAKEIAIKTAIDNFNVSCITAFPKGVQFEDVESAPAAVSNTLMENMQRELSLNGLKAESLSLSVITLNCEDADRFNMLRDLKTGLHKTFMQDGPGMAYTPNTTGNPGGAGMMGTAGDNPMPGFTTMEMINTINSVMNQSASSDEWTCSCGSKNKSKFCPQCGAPKK